MNKEQQELLDEVYEEYFKYTINGIETGLDKIKGYLDGCLVEYDGYYEHFTNPSFAYGYRTHNQESFINKCKTNTEFSERWGLTIEERELSDKERVKLYEQKTNTDTSFFPVLRKTLDFHNIPTKLITVSYKNEKIEVYEI
jgi:hypothetical protein